MNFLIFFDLCLHLFHLSFRLHQVDHFLAEQTSWMTWHLYVLRNDHWFLYPLGVFSLVDAFLLAEIKDECLVSLQTGKFLKDFVNVFDIVGWVHVNNILNIILLRKVLSNPRVQVG